VPEQGEEEPIQGREVEPEQICAEECKEERAETGSEKNRGDRCVFKDPPDDETVGGMKEAASRLRAGGFRDEGRELSVCGGARHRKKGIPESYP
jgi:hypothetical protein